MSDPVVTVTATIMDGTVVRWYRSVRTAEINQPTLSASRNGVMVHGEYLTGIPDDWITAARQAHETLRGDRDADVSGLATHRHRGVLNGPLVPVDEEGSAQI